MMWWSPPALGLFLLVTITGRGYALDEAHKNFAAHQLEIRNGPESVAQKLRRLALEAAVHNPLIDDDAIDVVVETSRYAPHSNTEQYRPDNRPEVFSVHGGTPKVFNSTFWSFPVSSIAPDRHGNLSGYYPDAPSDQAMGWEVEFNTNDLSPTLRVFGYRGLNSNFAVIIDGRYVAKTAMTYANDGLTYVQLKFNGRRKRRRIQFRSMGGNLFGGVIVSEASSVWKTDQGDVVTAVVTGDSYTDRLGYLGSTELPDRMWCHVLAHLLGWRDIRQVAVGGTGYLNNGKTRSVILDQLPHWLPMKPDVVVIAAGYNDSAQNAAALSASALLVFRTIRQSLPNALIIVLGPWGGAGGPSNQTLRKEAAIESAVHEFADSHTVFIPQNNIPNPWLTGTGNIKQPTGTGNADKFISSDGIHPSAAGHIHIGYRAAASIRDALLAFE